MPYGAEPYGALNAPAEGGAPAAPGDSSSFASGAYGDAGFSGAAAGTGLPETEYPSDYSEPFGAAVFGVDPLAGAYDISGIPPTVEPLVLDAEGTQGTSHTEGQAVEICAHIGQRVVQFGFAYSPYPRAFDAEGFYGTQSPPGGYVWASAPINWATTVADAVGTSDTAFGDHEALITFYADAEEGTEAAEFSDHAAICAADAQGADPQTVFSDATTFSDYLAESTLIEVKYGALVVRTTHDVTGSLFGQSGMHSHSQPNAFDVHPRAPFTQFERHQSFSYLGGIYMMDEGPESVQFGEHTSMPVVRVTPVGPSTRFGVSALERNPTC